VLSLVKHLFVMLLLSPTLSDQKLIMCQQLKQISVQLDVAHMASDELCKIDPQVCMHEVKLH
jgi:hypothetical protein